MAETVSPRTAPKLPKIESSAKFPHIQGFVQVLRTWGEGGWGGSLKFDGGQYMGQCVWGRQA